MLKKRMVTVFAVGVFLWSAALGAVCVDAGGLLQPDPQEKQIKQQQKPAEEEPVGKMPVFEYKEEPAKKPLEEQSEGGVKEKTWVWFVLGFAGALFLTSL